MLGAHAVQLASVIQQQGYDAITRIIGEVESWMDAHGYTTVEQLRGAALSSLSTFEDLNPRPLAARLLSPCDGLGCSLCAQGCLYQAVSMGPNGIHIDPDVCSGCGLCVQPAFRADIPGLEVIPAAPQGGGGVWRPGGLWPPRPAKPTARVRRAMPGHWSIP